MKTVLAAVNSKFIHMSLAPWYLKAACGEECGEIEVMEFTINRDSRGIVRALYEQKPDVLGLSCYIFNIIQIEDIVNAIRKLLPHTVIVLGGPEVSYDAGAVLARLKAVDYVVCGEGEAVFATLLHSLARGQTPSEMPGLACRNSVPEANKAVTAPVGTPPMPFTDEMLARSKGHILYFEASRGCPFRCSYCLSPACGKARAFPLEWVRPALARVMASPAKQVKFVDRTFNSNPRRAAEIIRFILETAKADESGRAACKNYHFEAAADLFDEELLALLATVPRGLIQFEIGIQSLNSETLRAVGRKTDMELCRRNIARLLAPNNIHVHLDLIAGLPKEDYASFAQSFNGVYALHPHVIQLGFLKLLKGSALRAQAERRGILFDDRPPYEVLGTPELRFEELSRLADIAECVERLYNSGKFPHALDFLTSKSSSPFAFFERFSQYLSTRGCFERSLSLKELCNLFAAFAGESLGAADCAVFSELLKFDYFLTDSSCNPPESFARIYDPRLRELYNTNSHENGRVHFECFAFDPLAYLETGETTGLAVLRFRYAEKDPVTGYYEAVRFALPADGAK